MKKLAVAATMLAASLGSITGATAERSVFDVFQSPYGETRNGAHPGRNVACLGKPASVAYRSCGAFADEAAGTQRPAWRTLN